MTHHPGLSLPMPANVQAEQAVLGSLILDPDAIYRIGGMLTSDAFYRDAHRMIFDVIMQYYERNTPADFITLSDALERRGHLERVGGAGYLSDLINNVPTSSNVDHYARIVEHVFILRRLIEAGGRIIADAFANPENADVCLSEALERLYAIAGSRLIENQTRHPEGFSEFMETLSDRSDRHEEGTEFTGMETGFPHFDRMTGGLQPGDLIVLAARPSVGKSSMALNIATHSIRVGGNVQLFSLEMARAQLWERMVAGATGIDQSRLRLGRLENDVFSYEGRRYEGEWPLIVERVGGLIATAGTLYVDDTCQLTPLDIRSRVQKTQANLTDKSNLLVIVDYLQLVKTGRTSHRGFENRVQEISSITKELKSIARDLNVPVLALAQLSRAAEGIEPELHHLKESGSIEEDADLVLLMWLDAEAQEMRLHGGEDGRPVPYPIEAKLAKHRKGAVGPLPLTFTPWTTTFQEREA